MQVPVQISFRDMPVSDDVEAQCWAEAEALERLDDRINACRVLVVESRPRGTERAGFRVTIELGLADGAVTVVREPPEGRDDDIREAVREAFERAQRRLPTAHA